MSTVRPSDVRAGGAEAVAERLRITEIFHSLQGEARTVGFPTVFVRLTGCPLRCRYCDTEYAFYGGQWMTFEAILADVAQHGARYVTVTGGEPLAQKPCRELLRRLCDAGYQVSLETGGALDIGGIDPRVSVVMDLKTPGSGEQAKNLYANVGHLASKDQVKFVICDRTDYEWSAAQLVEHRLAERCEVLFSPAWGQVEPRQLAEWILADRLPVRLQVQLHKLLWGEERGR
jgi:7-carboxy-7-deazaguanine synthase